jgi:hypothetical protein
MFDVRCFFGDPEFIKFRAPRSKEHSGLDVRTVHCRMATRRPAGSALHHDAVWDLADVDFAGWNARSLSLRMAPEAKIRIRLGEHLAIDRAMGIVARGAAFAHGFVLENDRARLLSMTLRAAFVQSGHGQAAGRLENIAPMRIVALHAIHTSLNDRVMLWEVEFGMRFQVTLKASIRIAAGIQNEFAASATGRDVQASRAVARFTARLAGEL